MENLITASVPEHLCSLLQRERTGEVLMVTSSGVYLQFEECVLLLCDAAWGVLPIGIGVDDFEQVIPRLHLQQGQQVTLSAEFILFQSGKIRLIPQKTQQEKPRNAAPERETIRQAAKELASLHKPRGFSALVLPLVLGIALHDAAMQNPYCDYACQYLQELIVAFENRDNDRIRGCTEKLLGLGSGLTPSADDVLLGMLYVFREFPHECAEQTGLFQKTIARLCDQRTNRISAAYLKAIMDGAPFGRMAYVFRSLCGEERLDIQKLTRIGSNSGSEMLLGMLLALRICGYDISRMEELQ